MSAHVHHHAHGPAAGSRPPAAPAPSLLRLSASQRLAGAALISLALWALAWWAMQA